MPNWANLMLTKQGKVLQAKAIAGSTLTITKMKLGSGIIPDGVSPEDLTDLIQPKQALGLTAISVNGGLAKIQSIVTNAELSEGYYIRECGVFANDPDVGEIMYAIMTDTSPDFLPSASSSVVISEEFSINVVTENMANITAIIDPEGIVTVANARKIAEDKVTEHNEDTEAHPNDFNLKGITIGKGNVIATKKGDLLTLLAGKGINLLSDIKNKIITIVGKSKNAWNPNEKIIAGDIRYTEDGNGPSWAYLLCKTAGNTGTVEPTLEANAIVGQEINDGSVVWTVQKVGNAQLNSSNTFTALNTFRANLAVSNGTTAGSGGRIDFGISPAAETVQARISADALGGLFYHASTNQSHVFRIGTNNNVFVIRADNTKVVFSSNNKFFATVTHDGVAKWLGNANTATKLETSRTINGVAFDGTKDIIVDSNPVGTIIAVAYTGVPEGYMHCNGAAVNRTTYVNLFNKIGTTYGAGDGSTTFNLPNTVARFLEGGIGAGTYYEAGLPNITGNISAFKSSISGAFVGSNNTNRYDGWNDNEDEYAVSTSFDASRSNSIYGASTTVQPPAMTVIYCIKY